MRLRAQNGKNAFAAGAASRTPLGSLQRSPKPQLDLLEKSEGRKGEEGWRSWRE